MSWYTCETLGLCAEVWGWSAGVEVGVLVHICDTGWHLRGWGRRSIDSRLADLCNGSRPSWNIARLKKKKTHPPKSIWHQSLYLRHFYPHFPICIIGYIQIFLLTFNIEPNLQPSVCFNLLLYSNVSIWASLTALIPSTALVCLLFVANTPLCSWLLIFLHPGLPLWLSPFFLLLDWFSSLCSKKEKKNGYHCCSYWWSQQEPFKTSNRQRFQETEAGDRVTDTDQKWWGQTLCVWVLCLPVCLRTMHMQYSSTPEQHTPDSLGLELHMAVSHVGAGIKSWP